MDASNEHEEATGRAARAAPWILGLAIAIFAGALCANRITTNDLFWQLRTGHEIVATHVIPHADHYSWTRLGHPWVVHEWAAFVLFWLGYASTGGYAGVWVLQTVVVVFTCTLLYAALYRQTRAPLTAFVLCIWAAIVAAPYFQPRPHLFTYLFLTIFLLVLQAARRHTARLGALWLSVPLCVVWANLHAGVIVAVVILALVAAGDAVDAILARVKPPDLGRAAHLAALCGACAAATLINPYGWRLYQDFYSTVFNTTTLALVLEWASPNFHAVSIGQQMVTKCQSQSRVSYLLLSCLRLSPQQHEPRIRTGYGGVLTRSTLARSESMHNP